MQSLHFIKANYVRHEPCTRHDDQLCHQTWCKGHSGKPPPRLACWMRKFPQIQRCPRNRSWQHQTFQDWRSLLAWVSRPPFWSQVIEWCNLNTRMNRWFVIISIIKCEMKLLIHSQISTVDRITRYFYATRHDYLWNWCMYFRIRIKPTWHHDNYIIPLL